MWPDNDFIRTTGGNLYSLICPLLPIVWITRAFIKKQLNINIGYWIFILLSTLCYLFAEVLWIYYETVLRLDMGFPGISDFFYSCSVIFYFLAFVYKIYKYNKKSLLIKFVFDIGIILSVTLTFSWYYILSPLIAQTHDSFLSLLTILIYPVSDILLVLCVATLYLGGEYFFTKRSLYILIIALSILIFSDSIYFFEIAQDSYFSGSWFDPLFVLPIMLIGYTVLLEREGLKEESITIQDDKMSTSSIFRLTLPYLLVIALFIFMMNHSNGLDAISIGTGISIILVILRQFVVIFENRNLVERYCKKANELEISEERYRSLFEYHPDSVFSLDLGGKIESMNSVGASLLGKDKKTLIGSPITDFIDAKQLKKARENIIKTNEGWINSHQFSFKCANGEKLWIDMTHIPIKVKSELVGSFGVGRDITEQKSNQEKVHYYAYHDHLTGLANRRSFESNLKKTIRHAEIYEEQFAILFLDLDKFKEINDVYGHAAGDDLLVAIAERINLFIEEDDLAARLGGDEFTILLKNISAYLVHERIQALRALLSEPHLIDGHSLICNASVGFAYYPIDGTTATELLSRADNAMYRVKRSEQYFK